MVFEKPIEVWALLFEYTLSALAPRVERGRNIAAHLLKLEV